jgi:ATP-dependent DNA helicase RecG
LGEFYNPILVSYVAKGLLPYRGFGSGIPRALEVWPAMDFVDDRDGCLFTATVHRKTAIGSEKTSGKILAALKQDGNLTIPELASLIGVTERSIERNVRRLQEQGPTPPHRSGQGRALGGLITYNRLSPDFSQSIRYC